MFILNLNKNKISKIMLAITCIIVIGILICVCRTIFFTNDSSFKVNDELNDPNIMYLDSQNYTNTLNTVHEDINAYVGKTINFSGYIYRLLDFESNQFVLARNMLIDKEKEKTVVVGFLCELKDSEKIPDNTWVNITGKIEKGNYHGEIPIIKITKIEKIQKPQDELVYPPDNFYIPTSILY